MTRHFKGCFIVCSIICGELANFHKSLLYAEHTVPNVEDRKLSDEDEIFDDGDLTLIMIEYSDEVDNFMSMSTDN